jgi:hypothetical protein
LWCSWAFADVRWRWLPSWLPEVRGRLGSSLSVRSSASDGDAAFVGDFVMTTDDIPETSETPHPSIFKMTPDGTAVLWHYAP